jgi:hypothetical protein
MNPTQTNQPVSSSGVFHVLAVAALLSLSWLVFLKLTATRASLAESNFQSNIIRADDYFYGPEKAAAVIGTSITGRLLPEYFQEQDVVVANLGLDGCIPRTGIELALKKKRLPKTIFVESTGGYREPRGNDTEILGFIEGVTFKLGRWLPLLRADTRPSSMLYSRMKQKNDARQITQGAPAGSSEQKKSLPDPAYAFIPAAEQARIAERATDDLKNSLAALSARGVHVVLMRLPVGGSPLRKPGDAPDATDRFAEALSLEVLDVASILHARGIPVAFSDGTHMVAPSAREAAKVICEKIKAETAKRNLKPET